MVIFGVIKCLRGNGGGGGEVIHSSLAFDWLPYFRVISKLSLTLTCTTQCRGGERLPIQALILLVILFM